MWPVKTSYTLQNMHSHPLPSHRAVILLGPPIGQEIAIQIHQYIIASAIENQCRILVIVAIHYSNRYGASFAVQRLWERERQLAMIHGLLNGMNPRHHGVFD